MAPGQAGQAPGEEPRGGAPRLPTARSPGSGTPSAEAMAAAEQAEDQDQDAISEKKVINRTFLSLSQITALSEQTIEGVQTKMEEFLNFERITVSFKEAILLDYYTSGFLWAKEMNFSLIQLSGFMDLLNFLLENLSDKHMTLGDNLKELGKAMAGIRETDSEGDLNFFSIEEAKAVIDYLNISLFKHYKQYEYLFQNHTEELLISNEIMLEDLLDELREILSWELCAIPPDFSYLLMMHMEMLYLIWSKGSDQEPESFETDSMDGVIDEELKSAVAEILNEIICNLEAELDEELQMQEEA